MNEPGELARRGFHQLTLSAIAGLMAGVECAAAAEEQPASTGPARRRAKAADVSNPLLSEPHVCRGLNTCKGLGADQRNACAGQGTCATAPHHPCAGHNECRGLGACYQGDPAKGEEPDFPGENTCKARGGCEVPLQIRADSKQRQVWEKARRRFIALMGDVHGIHVGNPPPPR